MQSNELRALVLMIFLGALVYLGFTKDLFVLTGACVLAYLFGLYTAEVKRSGDRRRDRQATERDEHDPYWQKDMK